MPPPAPPRSSMMAPGEPCATAPQALLTAQSLRSLRFAYSTVHPYSNMYFHASWYWSSASWDWTSVITPAIGAQLLMLRSVLRSMLCTQHAVYVPATPHTYVGPVLSLENSTKIYSPLQLKTLPRVIHP